jgi:CRISPR-associated endoribonuclease Cas6
LISRAAWFEIRFQLRALEGGSVPRFLGPVIHGAFGHALRQACEVFPDASDINELCYSGGASDGRPANNPNWCQPFAFDVGLNEGGEVQSGRTISAMLIGKPVLASQAAFFPSLLLALQIMAQNGLGPDLVKFDVCQAQIFPAPIFKPRRDGIDILPSVYKSQTILRERTFRQRAAIVLKTPTQLVSKGRMLRKMDGQIFFRRLWQRLTAWTGMEAGKTIKPPFFDEIEVEHDAVHWWKVERYSTRQQKRLDVSGMVGEAVFRGLDPFSWSLLVLGERLHVGKNTTSGLGKYLLR